MTGGLLTGFEIWLICYTGGASEGFYPCVIESIDSDTFEKTNLIQGTDEYQQTWDGLRIGWAMCLLLIQIVINPLGLPHPDGR